MRFETLNVCADGLMLRVAVAAPSTDRMDPGVSRDPAVVIRQADGDPSTQVIVFAGGTPNCIIAHIDVSRVEGARSAGGGVVSRSSAADRGRRSRRP